MSFIGRGSGRYRVVTLAPAMDRADRFAKAAFALLCIGSLVGFLVYPTYPNYDSYYSLLWGREVLDLQAPTFEGFRVPTEHPLAIVAGAALSLLGDVGDRVWIALIIASYLWLVAGGLPARADRLHAAGRHDRRGAAADALRLRVPDRARLHRHPLHGDGRVGGGAGGRAPAPRHARCSCCSRSPACCARRRGCWRPSTGAGWRGRRAGASGSCYAVLAAAGPVLWAATDFAVTGDPLFSLHYTSSSAEELGRNLPLSELPSAMPGVLRQPRQAARAGGGRARPGDRDRRRARAARPRRSRCSPRGSPRSC